MVEMFDASCSRLLLGLAGLLFSMLLLDATVVVFSALALIADAQTSDSDGPFTPKLNAMPPYNGLGNGGAPVIPYTVTTSVVLSSPLHEHARRSGKCTHISPACILVAFKHYKRDGWDVWGGVAAAVWHR